jgi:MoxR-like ATPase
MFGSPGRQEGSLLERVLSGHRPAEASGKDGRPPALDMITRLVFFSHLRQPEEGSRKAQQLAHILKDPEQIERQARLLREDQQYAGLLQDEVWQYVHSGASPRAQMFLAKAAVCELLLRGDASLRLDHIREVAHDVLRHRIRVNVQARVRGIQPEDVVDVLLQRFAPSAAES